MPVIVHRNYTGADVQISEYTMSEIVATLYDTIEATGIKEGILSKRRNQADTRPS